MKRQTIISSLLGAFTIALFAGGVAHAEDDADETTAAPQTEFVDADGDGIGDGVARRHRMHNRGLRGAFHTTRREQMETVRAGLTEEQRTELDALVAELKEGEATREDIHAAVGVKLQEYGVTLPENWGETFQQFAAGNRLTEEQRTEVKALVDAMEAEGKTREDIRAAVEAKHAEWGVVMLGGPGGPRGRHPVAGNRLTEEQRAEVGALVEAMKSDGKTREEIGAAIEAKHAEWGVEMPPPPKHGGRRGMRRRHGR